jgi:hypothetical protein
MDDKRTFGRQGYVVAPQVVPPEAVQAAMMAVDELLRGQPLPEEHRGHWSYWLRDADHQTFLPLLMDSPAFGLAGNLVGPEALEAPDFTQIALCIPPWRHRPGGPHLDGLSSAKPGAPPDSFTLLVGILLTDQPDEDMGNLWVWPGTHRQYAGWLRQHGPDALVGSEPAPPIQLPPPCQVVGRAGDVILAHYLLGHNIGGNTSDVVRRVAYFRLQAAGHRERWREVVQDEFREFEPVLRAE